LSWDDEHYYLIGFSEKHDDFIHYRVDRMTDVEIVDEARVPLPRGAVFNLADYSKKIFRMFGGQGETVEMWFDNSLVNVVIDRFGKHVRIMPRDEKTFVIKTEVVLSGPFYAWIFQFGDKAGILSPSEAVKDFMEFIEKTIKNNLEIQGEVGDNNEEQQ
jgi:predicted DNA-binding transcriptional regulator YafY